MSLRSLITGTTVLAVAGALVLTGCGGPTLPPVFNTPPPATSSDARGLLPGSDSGSGSGGVGSTGTFNSDCLGVASAYSSIALALLPSLGAGTGSGTYNSAQMAQAISTLGGSVPAPLKGDFQTLSDAAKSASGKNLADAGQILESPAVSAASDDIDKWMTANCGG